MKLSKKEIHRIKNQYGTWAVVTGASSGIGLALAERLAEAGLNLIINSRNLEKLQDIATDFVEKYSVQVIPVAADVSTSDGIEKIIS